MTTTTTSTTPRRGQSHFKAGKQRCNAFLTLTTTHYPHQSWPPTLLSSLPVSLHLDMTIPSPKPLQRREGQARSQQPTVTARPFDQSRRCHPTQTATRTPTTKTWTRITTGAGNPPQPNARCPLPLRPTPTRGYPPKPFPPTSLASLGQVGHPNSLGYSENVGPA